MNLPCGCELSHSGVTRFCQVAKELWQTYEAAYAAAMIASPEWENKVAVWSAANAAHDAYQEHFKKQKKEATR